MTRFVLTAVLLAMAARGAGQEAAARRVLEEGFESFHTDCRWERNFSSFKKVSDFGFVQQTEDAAKSGKSSLEIRNDASQQAHLYTREKHKVSVGDKIKISVWVRGSGFVTPGVYLYSEDKGYLSTLTGGGIKAASGEKWERGEVVVTIPDKHGGELLFRPCLGVPGGSLIMLDELSVEIIGK